MSNDDDYAPDEEEGRALVEEFQNNAHLSAERVKYDPWQREYRRVAAEVERTGNQSLFMDFQRRFLMALGSALPTWNACVLVRRGIHVKVTRWRSLRANRDRRMRGRKRGSRNKVNERHSANCRTLHTSPSIQNSTHRFKMALKPEVSAGW